MYKIIFFKYFFKRKFVQDYIAFMQRTVTIYVTKNLLLRCCRRNRLEAVCLKYKTTHF